MPYVIKDQNGKVIAMHENEQALTAQWVDDDDPAVDYFKNCVKEDHAKSILETSDLELIRVIEDLTELLIKKQVFVFTELPLFAQQKLGKRQKIRNDMISLNSLLNDENDEGIFR